MRYIAFLILFGVLACPKVEKRTVVIAASCSGHTATWCRVKTELGNINVYDLVVEGDKICLYVDGCEVSQWRLCND